MIRDEVLGVDVDGPAESSQFDDIVDEDDVLGFQVAVDDAVGVKVDQCFYGLLDVAGRLGLTEILFGSESIPQRT